MTSWNMNIRNVSFQTFLRLLSCGCTALIHSRQLRPVGQGPFLVHQQFARLSRYVLIEVVDSIPSKQKTRRTWRWRQGVPFFQFGKTLLNNSRFVMVNRIHPSPSQGNYFKAYPSVPSLIFFSSSMLVFKNAVTEIVTALPIISFITPLRSTWITCIISVWVVPGLEEEDIVVRSNNSSMIIAR